MIASIVETPEDAAQAAQFTQELIYLGLGAAFFLLVLLMK